MILSMMHLAEAQKQVEELELLVLMVEALEEDQIWEKILAKNLTTHQ